MWSGLIDDVMRKVSKTGVLWLLLIISKRGLSTGRDDRPDFEFCLETTIDEIALEIITHEWNSILGHTSNRIYV